MKKYWLFLLLAVFFLNTASHDFFCHEEIEGLCSPLHIGSIDPDGFDAAGIPVRPALLTVLAWTSGRMTGPGFITDIDHPPDFASLP
jgi:hypothetical protein